MAVQRTRYVDRLQRERDAAKPDEKVELGPDGKPLARVADVKKEFLKPDPAQFKGTRVPEKLLDIHGASFQGALPHLVDLAKVSEKLEPWQANHFNRALEQFYGTVAKQLDGAPEASRPALTAESVTAMRELVTRLDPQGLPVVVAAMAAANNVIDAGVRLANSGALTVKDGEHSAILRDTFQDVTAFAQQMNGRDGSASALNAYWYLAEQLELGKPGLTPAKRKEIRGAVAQFLSETAPRRGFDQALMAHLAELVGKASAESPNDFKKGLRVAKERFYAELAPLRNQTLAQLDAVPPEIQPGTPARAYLDSVTAELKKVVDANPSGPTALLEAVEAFHQAAVENLKPMQVQKFHEIQQVNFVQQWVMEGGQNVLKNVPQQVRQQVVMVEQKPGPEHAGFWQNIDKLLGKAARAPAGEDLLRFLSQNLTALAQTPGVEWGLIEAAKADSLGLVAKELATGLQQTLVAHLRTAEQTQAIARLAALDGGDAFRVLNGAWPHQNNLAVGGPLLDGLTEMLKAQRGAVSPDEVAQFVSRFSEAYPLLRQYIQNPQEATATAVRVTRAASAWPPDTLLGTMNRALQSLNWIRNFIPEPGALLTPDAAGRPGILQLVDPTVRYRNANPENYLNSFMQVLQQQGGQLDAPSKLELTRFAIELAQGLGHMDGQAQVPFQTMWQIWPEVVAGRAKFHRAAGDEGPDQMTALEFVKAYPQLPADLALVAGARLDPEELRWVVDRVSATNNKDTVRALRDFIFACVTGNQMAMIDVVRNSKSPAKAISAAIAHIGYEYRNPGQQGFQIPWVALAAGLAVGGDPVAELEKAKAAKATEGFKLADLGGRVDPAGVVQLNKAALEIASITDYFDNAAQHGGDANQFDFTTLRAPFIRAIRDIATGDWPRSKYENDVGKRLMSILTPEQQMKWRREKVTPLNGEAPKADDGYKEALTLLKGLRKALPLEVKLGHPELPKLDWDQASVDALSKLRDATLQRLHDVEKGSADHRKLSGTLGMIQRSLAVIELQQSLESAIKRAEGDPKTALLSIKPLLKSAENALSKAGVKGSSEAIQVILDQMRNLQSTPRQGRYAADEDGLVPLITSNLSGCLNAMNGFRRWGLVGALTDANIRMLRVYNGEKFVYRGFLKFFPVELPDYKGPALWLDTPVADGGGNAEDLTLMLKHAIAKAQEMGVPLLTGLPQANQLAQQEGLPVKANVQVTFQVEEGNTPVQHSDALFGGLGNVHANRGNDQAWALQKQIASVVMPKAGG